MTKLSLVVPCYNEEATLAACVQRVLDLKSETLDLEIIIVDDCSSDTSREVAHQLAANHPEIILVFHNVNSGKGAALRSGFQKATGDYVGIQDADLEYNPLDYLLLLGPLLDGKADVVYGSRYLKAENRRVLYFWHTVMNKGLTFVSNMFTNLDITDMETCYKLFRRDVIKNISLVEDRFGFEPEVTAKVAQYPCRVYECAIGYNPRSYEEGKKIGWKDGVRALYCIFHYSAHIAPLPLQLLIYAVIGFLSAVVNIAVFLIQIGVGQPLWLATIASFIIAAAVNYLLSTALLFKHKARWSSLGEIGAYAVSVIIMGALDYVLTIGLINSSAAPFTAKVLSVLVGFMGNFLLRKYFVFPIRRAPQP
jgi:glycosyltransferase involved in cell wall biosynthesis